mgnify:FL=1
MMQDALAGGDGLIVQYLAHHVRNGDRQGVRLRMAPADGETGLGVTIDQEDLLSALGQSYTEIYASCRFSHTALLIDQSDDLGIHGSQPPSKINDNIR